MSAETGDLGTASLSLMNVHVRSMLSNVCTSQVPSSCSGLRAPVQDRSRGCAIERGSKYKPVPDDPWQCHLCPGGRQPACPLPDLQPDSSSAGLPRRKL